MRSPAFSARGATGAVFSQGTYEFTRANGDLVIGYKSRGTDGSETFDTFVRAETTPLTASSS